MTSSRSLKASMMMTLADSPRPFSSANTLTNSPTTSSGTSSTGLAVQAPLGRRSGPAWESPSRPRRSGLCLSSPIRPRLMCGSSSAIPMALGPRSSRLRSRRVSSGMLGSFPPTCCAGSWPTPRPPRSSAPGTSTRRRRRRRPWSTSVRSTVRCQARAVRAPVEEGARTRAPGRAAATGRARRGGAPVGGRARHRRAALGAPSWPDGLTSPDRCPRNTRSWGSRHSA